MADEMTEGADQAPETVETQESQTADVVQGDPAVDQVSGQQSASEIVVGNQRFPDQQALVKAYQEAQRGHTQSTQKYSQELKALNGLKQWLVGMKGDKAKWDRFISYVNSNGELKQEGQAQPAAQAAPVVDDISDRLTRAEAALEMNEFRVRHPDTAQDVMGKVFDLMEEREQAGERMSLESAYRFVMHDDFSQRFVSEGQRKAEESMKKGKNAVSLGSTPSAAGAKPQPKTPWNKRQGASGQNQRIGEIFDEQGIKFDKE